mmetsp:Transcript_233/g.699  ORF Transcript_233/g.699 Transcript_233/m.699 type:complete len:218 (+) Transcript_233:1246-1899(+)
MAMKWRDAASAVMCSPLGSECSKHVLASGDATCTETFATDPSTGFAANANRPGPKAPRAKPTGARTSRAAERPRSLLYSTTTLPAPVLVCRGGPKNFSAPCSFHARYRRRLFDDETFASTPVAPSCKTGCFAYSLGGLSTTTGSSADRRTSALLMALAGIGAELPSSPPRWELSTSAGVSDSAAGTSETCGASTRVHVPFRVLTYSSLAPAHFKLHG